MRVEEDIDTRTAAVGDPVRGTVERDVKRDGKVIVPKGAKVLGRINQLQSTSQPVTILGLQLLRLEFQNQWAALTAQMDAADTLNPAGRGSSTEYSLRAQAGSRQDL